MSVAVRLTIFRMLPPLFFTSGAIAYVAYVEGPDAYAMRNTLPMLMVLMLSALTLYKGGGHWAGAGWSRPLGTLGFSIPAIGLSLYLHYAYSTDLNGMFADALYPQEVFRYLPIYTAGAGAIGFAIGWIAGRNV